MKRIVLMLITILSPLIQAASLDSLIAEHGKKAIAAELEDKLNHKLTVIINGDMVQAHSPNPDFMTAETLAIDINRAGLTVNQLAAEFEKRQQQAKAEQIRIEEINRQYQAKLEQQRQQAQRYREEEIKFWQEASDDEKQKFRTARANAEKEQIYQQKAAVEAENRRLRESLARQQRQPTQSNDAATETIDIDSLFADYKANTVAADLKYKGKRYIVRVTIADINTDIFGTPYVTMKSPDNQFLSAHFKFDRSEIQTVSRLSTGQRVTLECIGSGDVIKQPMSSHCKLAQ